MSARPGEPDPAKHARTALEASERLGVDERTFRRWRGLPWFLESFKTSDGWDVEAIREARPREDEDQAAWKERRRALDERDAEATVRQRIADAELKEMRTREKAGSLIPRKSHELHWAELLTLLASEFEQLPSLAAMHVSKKDQDRLRSFLETEGNAIRNRVADRLSAMAKELDSDASRSLGGDV